MRIEIGTYAGFCRGVKSAVDRAFTCSRELGEEEVLTDGELIHNPQTLRLLEQHGVRILDSSEPLERARDKLVVIRAHGVAPQRLAELRSVAREVRNFTCRDVGKVQGIIRNRSNRGASVVIFGKRDHPEVIGLLGYAERGFVVASPEEVAALPPLDTVLLVSQTTMSKVKFGEIAERVRERFPAAEVVDTICDATELRQKEVVALASRNDCVLVIGAASSSNTHRLHEIAGELTSAYLVSEIDDVRSIPLERFKRIGVTAGASTPDWLIHEVVEEIRRLTTGRLVRLLKNLVRFALYSKLFVAVGASLLSLAVADIISVPFSPDIAVLVSLYYLSMSLLNTYTSRRTLEIDDPGRYRFSFRCRHLFAAIFAGAVAGLLALAVHLGPQTTALTLVSLALGVGYNLSYLPLASGRQRVFFIPSRHLRALKSLVISLAVTVLITGLTTLDNYPSLFTNLSSVRHLFSGLAFPFSIAYVFLLMFTRQALFEMKTAQTDRIAGVSSLLNLVQRRMLTRLLYALPTLLLMAMLIGLLLGAYPPSRVRYFVAVGYNYLLVLLARDRRILASPLVFELLVDSSIYVAGLIALA